MSPAPVPVHERAALVALVSLPEVGPARLTALIDAFGSASAAWEAVAAGRLHGVDLRRAGPRRDELVRTWSGCARVTTPGDVLARHVELDVAVLLPGDPAWPPPLDHDPEPPRVLFARGDLGLLARRGVAVIGTRRCSAAGAQVARRLGSGLADAGVTVVSGLALGIDGAAHRGALDAGGGALGVVGSGLDHVYPHRNRDLWERVGAEGVLVSEAPLGSPPERWRFPARNRLIAALSVAVVVVESRDRGGSMTTVDEAERRQVDVLAVPGPVLAEQSAGTNRLLTEGAGIVRDAADVLAAVAGHPDLDLATARRGVTSPGPGQPASGAVAGLFDDPVTAAVAEVLSPTPAGIEQLASAAGTTLPDAVTALARLEAAGFVRRVGAGYERVVP